MKKFGKRALSVVMTLVLLITSFSVGLVASASVSGTAHNPVYIVVPETVYLTPSSGTTNSIQYYINNTMSSSGAITLDAEAAQTKGKVYFKCDDATSVKVKAESGSLTICGVYTIALTNGYGSKTDISLSTLQTGLAAGATSQIKWTFTATMTDGTTEEYVAYTTAYAPYYTPVASAVRTATNSGGSPNLETISWISGIHGVSSSYSYTTTGYNSDNDTDCSVKSQVRLDWLTPMLGNIYTTGAGSRNYTKAGGDSSATYCSDESIVYCNTYKSGSGSNRWRSASAQSPTGVLTVDISRNKNLNTVPNINVGFIITYLGYSNDKNAQYGIAFADITDASFNGESGNCFHVNGYWNDDPTWSAVDLSSYGTVIGGINNTGDNSGIINNTTKGAGSLVYSGPWNRSIAISTGTSKVYTTYAFGKQYAQNTYTGHVYNHNFQHLQVYAVSKADLRAAIQKCTQAGYQESWISSGTWSTYQTRLQEAYNTLGNPTASSSAVTTAINNLNNAFTGLTLKSVTATAKYFKVKRVIDGTGATTAWQTNGSVANDDASSFNADQKVTFTRNDVTGSTYIGYSLTGTGTTFTVGVDELNPDISFSVLRGYRLLTDTSDAVNFFYKQPDVNININANGGTWNGNTGTTTVTASEGTVFTPVAPTRDCYDFTGWTLTVAGGGTFTYGVFTCGSTAATLTANWQDAGTHDWQKSGTLDEATCTSTGVDEYTCSICNETKTEVTPMTEHNWGAWTPLTVGGNYYHEHTCADCNKTERVECSDWAEKPVAPNCTEEGYTIHYCKDCNNQYATDYTNALGHDFEHGTRIDEESKAPTCEEEGYDVIKCSRCDVTTQVTVTATGHDWTAVGTTAPTCTAQGFTTYICLNDPTHTKKDDYVDALGHAWDEGTVTRAATCTQEGEMTYKCTRDGCDASYTAAISMIDHSYGEWEVVTPATCLAAGEKKHTCTACGHEETEVIPQLAHEYVGVETKAATCTEDGITTYTCKNGCNQTYTEPITKLGHKWDEGVITTDPTCTETGVKTFTCLRCGETTTTTVDALGHDYSAEEEVIRAATCTETGLKAAKCSRCGDYQASVVIPALGHEWITEVEAQEPTCTETGCTEGKHCNRCNEVVASEVIEALGHDWIVTKESKKAGCESIGWTQEISCSRCGDILQNSEEIPATGHKYNAVTTAPTCTAQGYTTYTCEYCGDSYRADYVDALGHTWGDPYDEVPATCTVNGSYKHTCTTCGTERTEVVRAPGHTWSDGVITKRATCTEAGAMEYTCTVCGYKRTTVIPMLDHNYIPTVTPPTCTTDGYTTYVCSICGYTYIGDEVTAPGHSYIITIVSPNCTEQGYTKYECTTCGEIHKDNYVAAYGHIYDETVVPATCTEQGYTEYVCQVCRDSYRGDYTEPLGHDYVDRLVAPTCTEKGYTEHVCRNCGLSYRDEYTDPIGHSYVETGRVSATNTKSGYISYQCEHCGASYNETLYIGGKALVCVTLYDENHKPVTEAKIDVTDLNTDKTFTIYTDLNGYFTYVFPQGEYELKIHKDLYENETCYLYVQDGLAHSSLSEDAVVLPTMRAAECDCLCHQNNIWAKLFRVLCKLFKILGMDVQCCPCSEL